MAPASPIIDFHVHINPLHLLKPAVASTFRSVQPQYEAVHRYVEDPAAFVELLDRQGIERACLINYVAPEVMGYPPGVNEWVHRYVEGRRDRLVPFGGFHPRFAEDAKKEIETLLQTYEIGGVKIHGPHSLIAPNAYLQGEKDLERLYQRCQDEAVPVMFHTGTSIFPGARNKYGDPMFLDDVAVDFPKLKIVLAHGGRPLWMPTAIFLVRRHPNVYMDVSGLPPKSLPEYFPRLESLSDKVIFGSDWPGPHVPGIRENADAVARLLPSDEVRRKVLFQNADRVLRRR